MKSKHSNSKIWNTLMLIAIGVAFFIPGGVSVQARDENITASTDPSDPAEIEKYWNGFFSREMDAYGVYGAVMVMVDEDDVLFAKGYGYADAALGIVIDPQLTILRAGSIAKSLTATAVMQRSEQGKLNLDADVNDYLTLFKVPDTFPEAVTTRHPRRPL